MVKYQWLSNTLVANGFEKDFFLNQKYAIPKEIERYIQTHANSKTTKHSEQIAFSNWRNKEQMQSLVCLGCMPLACLLKERT